MNAFVKCLCILVSCSLFSCVENTRSEQKKSSEINNAEGYISRYKDNWVFYDCSEEILYNIRNDTSLQKIKDEISLNEARSHWFYTTVSGLVSGSPDNEIAIQSFSSLRLKEFCSNERMLISSDFRFLGAKKGVHIHDIGADYGPLIGSKSDGKGGFLRDQFELHTRKSSFLATFFTNDQMLVQNIEIRSPLIALPEGIHTGMDLKAVLKILPCLDIDNGNNRYGMTVLRCKDMPVEFVFTQDYSADNQNIEQIMQDSRLYLIRL